MLLNHFTKWPRAQPLGEVVKEYNSLVRSGSSLFTFVSHLSIVARTLYQLAINVCHLYVSIVVSMIVRAVQPYLESGIDVWAILFY